MQKIIALLMDIKRELIESQIQNKEVFSLQEFCKYAGISEDYGYKLIRERQIKFYRPGGKKIYVDRHDAIAYLKQNAVDNVNATNQKVNNYFLTSKKAA